MWFSPRPQSKPRSHSGNGRGGCEPYASAFLTSSCILPPSVSQVPPRRICQINSIACRQEIWRCHRCGGKRRFPPEAPHGTAGHGRVWQTDRVRFATWLHLPRFQTPARVESPAAAWHSFSCRYDISRSWASFEKRDITWTSSTGPSPCAEEDRIIASKTVTQLYAKPVPFTTTAAPPLLSCSRVITILHPFLRSPLDRSSLDRFHRKFGTDDHLRKKSFPIVPSSFLCAVVDSPFSAMRRDAGYFPLFSLAFKILGRIDGRFPLGRTRFFRSRSGGEEEGDGRREGGEILTRVAKAR